MASPAKKRKLYGRQAPLLSAFAARTLQLEVEEKTTQMVEEEDSSEVDESLDESLSRAESPEVLLHPTSIELSKIQRDNIRPLEDGTLLVEIAPGERLVLLGECKISIDVGQITIMGATLRPSKTRHRFYAPSSHSLPVIRCPGTETNTAKIRLHQSESGLASLSSMSPLFGKMWCGSSEPLSGNYDHTTSKSRKNTFQVLFSSEDNPQKAFLQPIISAPEWNQVLSRFSNVEGQKTPAIMICGPKSSGKSTFAKILSHKLLLDSVARTGVALLDLDPGQPEYSVPGQLSLVHLQQPNFGPPFSHPWPTTGTRLVRAHTIAAITPAQDPELYMSCALDLFAHYRILLSQNPNCALVINTPGWVLGTGLENLVDLITNIRPTDVIYMSQEGPWDVVNSLREAAKTTPMYTLPSQTCEYTTRTAAHLRTMQAMSYFHLDSSNKGLWNTSPLSSIPPWEVRYAGEGSIFGILPYGDPPSAEHLLDSINGSVVAIVVVDDIAAIPGLKYEDEEGIDGESSMIIHAEDNGLPYFKKSFNLDPEYSHCIGLGLIRGVDIARQRLQLLTPIAPTLIEEINEEGKRIVLVSGRFDTPGWAYTEGAVEDFESVPWVETLEGSQGRGVGGRVWRVRRDLGRDGGD